MTPLPGAQRPTPPADAQAVILLHGLCRTPRSMQTMARALTAAGFIVLNVGYRSRHAAIETLAEETIGRAWHHPAVTTCHRIHFVTHSLGGILVRCYFAQRREPRLGRVVMLGPPNGGSEVVDRLGGWRIFQWLNGPAGGELGTNPDSTPNRLGPVGFELGVIAGNRSINWINSLMIPGANDGKVSVELTKVAGMADHIVLPISHPFLMSRPAAVGATMRFLQSGGFSPPGP